MQRLEGRPQSEERFLVINQEIFTGRPRLERGKKQTNKMSLTEKPGI